MQVQDPFPPALSMSIGSNLALIAQVIKAPNQATFDIFSLLETFTSIPDTNPPTQPPTWTFFKKDLQTYRDSS